MRTTSIITALGLALATPVAAEQGLGTIRGVIKAEGKALEGGRVLLVGTSHSTSTGARGDFEFTGLAAGRYLIRAAALGFEESSIPVDLQAGQVFDAALDLGQRVVKLPEVSVNEEAVAEHGPADWLRRKAEGRGRYLTRADLQKSSSNTIAEAVAIAPGLRVECTTQSTMVRTNRGWRPVLPGCTIAMQRAGRGCEPAFFLDGVRTPANVAYMTPTGHVEGIEIYYGPSETPSELEAGKSGCGVIAIWTRPPPPSRRQAKKNA